MEIINLIPEPREVVIADEFTFFINSKSKIVLADSCNHKDLESALLLQKEINRKAGLNISITKVLELGKSNLEGDPIIYLKRDSGTSQSYQLDVKKERIELIGADEEGLFYGIQTLRQLIRNFGVRIPGLSISDQPYFKYRGYYYDITRGKVPTLETLKELVEKISFYKINQLQLYVEHTFAFEKMSEIWQGSDPLTAEEIMLLDNYCQKRHVELVPSLSTFGHLYQALTTSSYGHLSELEAGPEQKFSWVDRQRHHTLDVSNPGSFELVKNMLDQYIPLFSSKKFNICCDETFDLGQGRTKELAAEFGKGRLYIDFLKKIINYVQDYNKEVMFWGDIILQHPKLMDEIPDGVVCLNWEYSAEPDENKVKAVQESGIRQYLCPGVSGWNMLMNDHDNAFSNIEKMVSYGKKYNALGILNTDWGDYGHVNLLANSLPAMIFAAGLSWNPDTIKSLSTDNDIYNKYAEIDKRISRLEFADQEEKIVGLLRKLARQQLVNWGDIVRWKESKFNETSIEMDNYSLFKQLSEKELKVSYNTAIELADSILELSMKTFEEKKQDFFEFYISAQGVALFDILALFIKKYELQEEGIDPLISPQELAVKLEYWLNDYKQAWQMRNKESELGRIEDMILVLCKYLREKGGIVNA